VAVPVAGAAGCSTSGFNTNLYTLTNAVQFGAWTPVVTNSNVWILGGADSSGSQIFLNGSALPGPISTLNNFTLTFKGGWTGIGGAINPASPSVFNGVGFSIGGWHNSVTMSNITVNNSPFGQDGIYIYSRGLITLTNVVVYHGANFGGYLDNSDGTGVAISNSSFDQNNQSFDDWGLYVLSNGAITLTNVVADQNFIAGGAYLDNSIASNKPVTIKNSYFDNNVNFKGGLDVLSTGAITLTDVSASGNTGVEYGAKLDNTSSLTAAPVTLTGTNLFNSNGADGLDVVSKGKITSGSISANNNGGLGTSLVNNTAITAQPITLTGTSSFTGNGIEGVDLWSHGAITANNLSADGNGNYGAWLYNAYSFIVPIKVTGTNIFANNGHEGLYVDSLGAISLNNITANGNGTSGTYDGLYVETYTGSLPHGITVTGTNNFNLNTKNGAEILATGPISVSNVSASYNSGGAGVTIRNNYLGSLKPQSVAMSGTNTLTYNDADNLNIKTYGAITINNLTANFSSTGNGADLGFNITGNVTLNGVNTFDFNHINGLSVVSKGTVLLNNLKAMFNNTGFGVYIQNDFSTTSSPVTLKGITVVDQNHLDGLDIFSKGKVTIGGLEASFNGNINSDAGARIVNSAASSAQGVTLTGTNTFNFNYGDGLDITSLGAVSVGSLTASQNGHSNSNYGANIYNAGATTAQPVTLTGNTIINFNYGDGMDLVSHGVIKLGNLTADYNGHTSSNIGAYIYNAGAGTAQNIMLSGTNFFDFNYGTGLALDSRGAITASNLNASFNSHSTGVSLNNTAGTAGITLTGTNTFNFNNGMGLHVASNGSIMASNLTANQNGSSLANYGVDLNNATGTGNVTLTGNNIFNNNQSDGIDIFSHGTITTNNMTANFNNLSFGSNTNDAGVWLDNRFAPTAKNITMNGVNIFLGNHYEGLDAFSKGLITTNNLTANDNGYYGAYFDNSSGVLGVNLKGSNTFLNNGNDGLRIISSGPVTVTHITANYNYYDGLNVNTTGNVTVTCGSFMNNGTTGSFFGYGWSTGGSVPAVTLIGVDASGNFSGDYDHSLGTVATFTPRTCTLP
jgi:hypothetical protein